MSLSLSASENNAFVGQYISSDHETRAELYLLDNKTFCYTFMGGSLDLMIAGTWEKNTQSNDIINFNTNKQSNNIHQAQGQQLHRIDNNISIVINGYSVSDINTPVFAISKTDKPPKTFRPLLPMNNNIGRANYAFQLFSSEDAKYFYLGNVISNEDESQQLRVTQYKVNKNDTFRLGFDKNNTYLPEDFYAQLIDNQLHLNGDYFSNKKALNQQTIEEVNTYCISPTSHNDVENQGYQWQSLTSINTFYFPEAAVSGEPYFDHNDDIQAREVNGLTALVKEEKALLEAEYQGTRKNLQNYEKLLNTATNLLLVSSRNNIYAPIVQLKLSQLLIDTVRQRNIESAKKQFNAYVKQIYPLIKNNSHEQVKYSVLVIASQGLIIYNMSKDEQVLTKVLDTLLGPDFSIETTNNPTLVYNLACIYALNRNKSAMLNAIRTARKMNKPTKQFLNDSDFTFYLKDPDFIAAINS